MTSLEERLVKHGQDLLGAANRIRSDRREGIGHAQNRQWRHMESPRRMKAIDGLLQPYAESMAI
jgi:hypothetical protein